LSTIVFIAWMVPLAELAFLGIGQVHWHYGFRTADSHAFDRLVIQVTTTGVAFSRVNEIVAQIRSYELDMPYEVWVVTEPSPATYPLADRVITVPETFRCRARNKARALEYSRLVRDSLGLSCPGVKILFVDDDVSLTKRYIERAFSADYDICQGLIAPRVRYAIRPFGHFVVSHADDIRTHACLVYCSVFQGILGRPLHVHGEGLAVTGEAEAMVTWDWPVVASEDLVFGQQAARLGLTWGWFHEYAEITSPWSFRDYFVQRRRWLWGDLHAIRYRSVISFGAAVRVSVKYLVGILALLCSALGLWLRVTGRISADSPMLSWAKLSILTWVGVIFTCGWIAASHRDDDSRLLAGVLAVVMLPVSVALTVCAIVIPLIQGDPKTFVVITKTREGR
jgi:Glycosyl transferase family group 2